MAIAAGLGAAAIGAAGSIGAAEISKSGSGQSDASNALWQGNQAYNRGAHNAEDVLRQYLGNATNYLQPYYDIGTSAEKQYAGALGVPGVPAYDPSAMVRATPGYQFGLSQGNDAMNAQMSAQGMYNSGPQREAAQKFGQQYGMNYYNQLMSQLSGLGQQGQNAGNQMGNWNMNTGTNIANLELGMGQNAQNTFATTGGLQMQSANQGNSNALGFLGTGISSLGSILGGGGGGTNFLGNMLGPLFSGAGGGGGGGSSLLNWAGSTLGA